MNGVPSSATGEALSGLIERVTFHNPENGFCVLRVKLRGHRELETVIGHAASVTVGEYLSAFGEWSIDREHGRQFKASRLRILPPTTEAGIEKYLGSGLIRGIGPTYAKRLVQAFGTEVFAVIEKDAAKLREIDGIGPIRAQRIADGWADQRVIRDIMVFLHANGVSTSRAVRIFKTYGQDAIELVKENPYRLARDIKGIGFLSADTIARNMGIAPTSLLRARAGISHALMEAVGEGHCGLPRTQLVPLAVKLLEIPQPIIEEALALELGEGTVVADDFEGEPAVFLASLHRAERAIARRLLSLQEGAPPWPAIDADKALPWVESKLSVALSASQREAVRLALRSKVLVITGGPGVGKTTLVKSILTILAAKRLRVALCAPTGRAAKRLSETTGLEAKTIHRLLEVNPRTGGFARNEDHPLDCDLLVADEASMVDVPLAHSLLRAVPPRAAVLLVGDVDQLPSVGPGQVLADVIGSGTVPVVRLTEVFRQAAQSRIIVNAHRINHGEMPEWEAKPGSDFYFINADEPEAVAEKLITLVKERIPRQFGMDRIREIQVLCPMNRGGTGARALNTLLQGTLNPDAPFIEKFGWRFCVGDKVM
ncbi:MAG: AAA family ATPase, partial [Phycisphaerales bacterium]|nr:AAA family ATPase [Phycisphaerales bacterium]